MRQTVAHRPWCALAAAAGRRAPSTVVGGKQMHKFYCASLHHFAICCAVHCCDNYHTATMTLLRKVINEIVALLAQAQACYCSEECQKTTHRKEGGRRKECKAQTGTQGAMRMLEQLNPIKSKTHHPFPASCGSVRAVGRASSASTPTHRPSSRGARVEVRSGSRMSRVRWAQDAAH
jgi:hypothetical protein